LNSHIQEVINFIPSAITLFIFFAFLRVNKNVKEFEAGPGGIKYKAKDDAAHKPTESKDNNSNKDIEQDKTINELFNEMENINDILQKNITNNNKQFSAINARLEKQYVFIRETALKSCAALVFNDNTPLIEFFDAVFLSLYLGANGNTIGRVTKRIVKSKENLEHYNSELSKFRSEHKTTNKHFEDAIEQIHREWH